MFEEKRERYLQKTLLERRRMFRKNPTKAENLLWEKLRARGLQGYKFRRQHGIGRYIVDFYHAQTRTIIEVDGSIHDNPAVSENDAFRQRYLEDLGYHFLRFSNDDVLKDIDSVLQSICNYLNTPKPLSLVKEREKNEVKKREV